MIERLHHVGISVSSLERSMAFYQDMFGLRLTTAILPFSGSKYERIMALGNAEGRIAFMSNGSFQVELFEFSKPEPKPKDPAYPVADHGISHFCIEVGDIDALYEKLGSANVPIHSPVIEFQGGIRAIYARDPDGNVFEAIEQPPIANK